MCNDFVMARGYLGYFVRQYMKGIKIFYCKYFFIIVLKVFMNFKVLKALQYAKAKMYH